MAAMHFTKEEEKFMLSLARKAIESSFSKKDSTPKNIPENLKQKAATFVTLHKNHSLRGCIGMLTAIRPLYHDIIHNAISAAFSDPRFEPVKKDELNKIEIEISILSEPSRLDYKDSKDLLSKLRPSYGIIINKGYNSTTFLPQVWEELPDKKEFLSHLCLKAGLSSSEWQNTGIIIYYYTVISFHEN